MAPRLFAFVILLIPSLQAMQHALHTDICHRVRVTNPTQHFSNINNTQPTPLPIRRCRFSISRTSKGLKILCECRHTTAEVPSDIIDGVSHHCLRNCLRTTTLPKACESGDRRFTHLAKQARDQCCENTCAGLPDGDTCVRTGPFSAPLQGLTAGCVVSFPVQPYGDQFACSCGSNLVVVSPILYAGVDKPCLMGCARGRLAQVCVPDRGRLELVDGMLDVFADCCDECRGLTLDAGLACGVRTLN